MKDTPSNSQPPAAGDSKHTPTPWLVNEDPRRLAWTIKPVNFPGASVGEVHGQSIAELQANAAFIVRACNSHADREELLRWFLEACESGELKSRDNDAASLRSFSRRMELARAALAKEGQS